MTPAACTSLRRGFGWQVVAAVLGIAGGIPMPDVDPAWHTVRRTGMEMETLNAKSMKIHGVGLEWS